MKHIDIDIAPIRYIPIPVKHPITRFHVNGKDFRCECGMTDFVEIQNDLNKYKCLWCDAMYDISSRAEIFEYTLYKDEQ